MELYKPLQYLKLVYDQKGRVVKLVSDINVLVGQYKILTRKLTEPSKTVDYLIEYFVKVDEGCLERFTFKDLVEFDILSDWPPENSETGIADQEIKDQVASAIKTDLDSKEAKFYKVTVEVYLQNGETGGKVTTTISENGDIVID